MSKSSSVNIPLARTRILRLVDGIYWKTILPKVFLLGVMAWLLWQSSRLPLLTQLLVWGLLLCASALLGLLGKQGFFGPVLFYDLVRLARRRQHILHRSLYTLALLLMVVWQYHGWSGNASDRALVSAGNRMSLFAGQFFSSFIVFQFLFVIILAPGCAAGAIAEEKQRGTLLLLLTTDLADREIVLGKLMARLASVVLIILTSLPILSLLQLWGGVDPNLVLASYAATTVTALSLTSFSVLCSVYVKQPSAAIVIVYLGTGCYLLLGRFIGFISPFAGTWSDGFNAGNIVVVLERLGEDVQRGRDLAITLPARLGDYAHFHVSVAVACVIWAVIRLRAVALQETRGQPRIRTNLPHWHPQIGQYPMVWKELLVGPGAGLDPLGRVTLGVFVGLSLLPSLLIAASFLIQWSTWGYTAPSAASIWSRFRVDVNGWVRATATLVSCAMLLTVAVRAAGSVSTERDRGTLDALLTTPLESRDILWAKWCGSLLGLRWSWLWLALIWTIGLTTGAVHSANLALSLLAWLVYACCLAGIGLWFSTASRTTTRATLYTVATFLLAAGGPWVIDRFWRPGWWGIAYLGSWQWLWELPIYLSPPATLYWLAFGSGELVEILPAKYNPSSIGFSLFLWCIVALIAWSLACLRLRRILRRGPALRSSG